MKQLHDRASWTPAAPALILGFLEALADVRSALVERGPEAGLAAIRAQAEKAGRLLDAELDAQDSFIDDALDDADALLLECGAGA